MAFEDFKPGSIPGYDDLELLAVGREPVLRRRLDRLLSPESQVFNLWVQRIAKSAGVYGEGLAQLVYSSQGKSEQPATAVYRGLTLGRFLVGMLTNGETIQYDPGTLLSHGESLESFRSYLAAAPDAYLSSRPTLLGLVGSSIPAICPSREDFSAVRVTATLTLIQAEEYRFDRFFAGLTSRLDDELRHLDTPPPEPPDA